MKIQVYLGYRFYVLVFALIGIFSLQTQKATCSGIKKSDFLISGPGDSSSVKLSNFIATLDGGTAILEWETGAEYNNQKFIIEKTTDAIHYDLVAEVTSKGNSEKENTYRFIDKKPSIGTSYYRLGEVDDNGTIKYMEITPFYIQGSVALSSPISVYPNPSYGDLYFKSDHSSDIKTVSIYDLKGSCVLSTTLQSASDKIDVSSLRPGAYVILLPYVHEIKRIKFLKI